MSLIDRLPTRRPRPQRKHRAPDEVERLRRKLRWADSLIKTQLVQLDDQHIALTETRAYRAEAEELVVKQQADLDDLTAERDGLAEELSALKRRFGPQLAADANAHRIDVPPMVRDTSAIEDQATQPIPVLTLQQAFGVRPVTDPGRIH